uniref:C-type lectin domain-containing protein n=1 Tax=Anopheles maculatus TaxID=74869 RepID=A0A182SF39_9DIPT
MKTVVLALVIIGLVAVGLPTAHALHYKVYSTKVTYWEAWQQCIANGGNLASIETATQNNAVHKAIKKTGRDGQWWLSGTDLGLEGSWIWLSRNEPVGTPYGYLNYAAGEPNNMSNAGEHYLVMRGDGAWNDIPCDSPAFYVCEFYSL